MGDRSRARKRAETRPRRVQHLGHERPGAVLRGPPVTVTCSCGRKTKLPFGSSWTCENCGRSWDTSRIPRDEYEAIRRLQLRFRVLPVLLGLLVVALAVFFTLTGNARAIFLLLPIALLGWFGFLRAPHRRRYREAIARRQKWTLHERSP